MAGNEHAHEEIGVLGVGLEPSLHHHVHQPDSPRQEGADGGLRARQRSGGAHGRQEKRRQEPGQLDSQHAAERRQLDAQRDHEELKDDRAGGLHGQDQPHACQQRLPGPHGRGETQLERRVVEHGIRRQDPAGQRHDESEVRARQRETDRGVVHHHDGDHEEHQEREWEPQLVAPVGQPGVLERRAPHDLCLTRGGLAG